MLKTRKTKQTKTNKIFIKEAPVSEIQLKLNNQIIYGTTVQMKNYRENVQVDKLTNWNIKIQILSHTGVKGLKINDSIIYDKDEIIILNNEIILSNNETILISTDENLIISPAYNCKDCELKIIPIVQSQV